MFSDGIWQPFYFSACNAKHLQAMRTIALSPAGRQPVRIATAMTICCDFGRTKHFRQFAKRARSISINAVMTAVAVAGTVGIIVSSVALDTLQTTASAVALAATTAVTLAALSVIYYSKGGEL